MIWICERMGLSLHIQRRTHITSPVDAVVHDEDHANWDRGDREIGRGRAGSGRAKGKDVRPCAVEICYTMSQPVVVFEGERTLMSVDLSEAERLCNLATRSTMTADDVDRLLEVRLAM